MAAWGPCFFLNVGYLVRPSKKLRKARSRWRRRGSQRNRGHLSQPGRLCLGFPNRQEGREIAIGEALACLAVGGGLAGKGLIVHPPTTAKGPGKHLALLGGGVAAVAIGTFDQAHREVFFFCRKEAETGAHLVPNRPKRNAPGIPTAEAEGFTARFDKLLRVDASPDASPILHNSITNSSIRSARRADRSAHCHR